MRRKPKHITDIKNRDYQNISTQMTLDGDECGYSCKCGKCFSTMSDFSKHQHKVHRQIKTSINFVLENYKMQCISKWEVIA